MHVGPCWKIQDRRQIKKVETIQKLNTTQKKETTQNTAKQNYPGLVAFYDTRPENEVGLFYNAPETTRDLYTKAPNCLCHYGHYDSITLKFTVTLQINGCGEILLPTGQGQRWAGAYTFPKL